MKRLWIAMLAATLLTGRASPFVNLDFETANTNNVTPIIAGDPGAGGYGTPADLLPGWRLFAGTTEIGRIAFNLASGGLFYEPISLFTKFSRDDIHFFVRGEFGFGMGTSTRGGITGPTYSLTQAGEVPADAKYLQFTALTFGGLSVQMDGVNLNQISGMQYSDSPKLLVYDIAPYAGHNVELRFELRNTNPQEGDLLLMDSIRFSTIPEPGTVALFALGGAFLLVWRNGARGKT